MTTPPDGKPKLGDTEYEMLTMDNILARIEVCGPHVLLRQYPEKTTATEGGKIELPDSAKKKRAFCWIIGLGDEAQAEGFALKQSVLVPFHAMNELDAELGKGICYVHMNDIVFRDKTMTVKPRVNAVMEMMRRVSNRYEYTKTPEPKPPSEKDTP